MTSLSHSSWFEHRNNTWREQQTLYLSLWSLTTKLWGLGVLCFESGTVFLEVLQLKHYHKTTQLCSCFKGSLRRTQPGKCSTVFFFFPGIETISLAHNYCQVLRTTEHVWCWSGGGQEGTKQEAIAWRLNPPSNHELFNFHFVFRHESGFLGEFAKFPKATISFITSVSPSVRPPVCTLQLCSHWKDIHDILYSSIFRKPVHKIHDSLQADKNNGYFAW